ncbi:MAG: hypothetical protein Kow0098_04060 [Ignavibacteriaceae bacterium]
MKFFLIPLVVVLIDQISKIFVRGINLQFLNLHIEGLPYGKSHPVIGNFFNITFIENPGIAFGIDFGEQFRTLITILTILTTLLLIIYMYMVRNENRMTKISVAVISGGAAGNLIDRLFYGVFYGYAPFFEGKVVDFLDINFFNIHLFNKTLGSYVFNFADLAVSIGVFFLILSLNRKKKENQPVSAEIENLLAENRD